MAKLLLPKSFDYQGWSDLLGTRNYKAIGNNTGAERVFSGVECVGVAIRLHRTNVVTFFADGRIVLNSGGYRSVTTKGRMNAVLPQNLGVIQKNYDWFVTIHNVIIGDFVDGYTIECSAVNA